MRYRQRRSREATGGFFFLCFFFFSGLKKSKEKQTISLDRQHRDASEADVSENKTLQVSQVPISLLADDAAAAFSVFAVILTGSLQVAWLLLENLQKQFLKSPLQFFFFFAAIPRLTSS